MAPSTSRIVSIQNIFLSECRFLERRYPELRELGLPLTPTAAQNVFEDYCWHVRRIDPAARAVDQVDFYEGLIPKVSDAALRDVLIKKLIGIQARRGLVRKVLPLLSPDDPNKESINALIDEHDRHYGYDTRRIDPKVSDRGGSLRFYIMENPAIFKGKRVVHFAPELTIRGWMKEAAHHIGFDYCTADGFIEGMDHYVDLCAMSFSDAQFDVVIIHRVLEHVIDDVAALKELHRILVPGGILNISVPEALYLETSADWCVPDPKTHMHFRMYGRNFSDMLTAAGFIPNRCDWLFQQSETRLRFAHAYPMRFFNAIRN